MWYIVNDDKIIVRINIEGVVMLVICIVGDKDVYLYWVFFLIIGVCVVVIEYFFVRREVFFEINNSIKSFYFD